MPLKKCSNPIRPLSLIHTHALVAAGAAATILSIALLATLFFTAKRSNTWEAEYIKAHKELVQMAKLREFCMPNEGRIVVTRMPDGSIDCSAEIVGFVK
jgi:hypothetical protein